MAQQFVSCLSKTAKAVPEDYIYPLGMRPPTDAPICKEIPVIDLSLAMGSDVHDRAKVAEQLLKAFEGCLGFQVINHGVSEKLMENAMEVCNEFFNLPTEDKEKTISEWTNSRSTGHYSGGEHPKENIHLWRDTLIHKCQPSENVIDSWPEKPVSYRKVIAEYTIETRKLSQTISELIAEGLGLEKQYFNGKFTKNQTLRANYYPKSPDPSLTTGFWAHYDPNTITILQQNVSGLQIFKDEKWFAVEPLSNAFYVTTGMELQIISNGRFKATLHQVATNAAVDRLSIGIFMSGTQTTVDPDKAFVSDENPPKYKDYTFEKYLKIRQSIATEQLSIVEATKSALDFFLVSD